MLQPITMAVRRIEKRPRWVEEAKRSVLAFLLCNPWAPDSPETIARALFLERDEVREAMVQLAEEGRLDVSGSRVVAMRPTQHASRSSCGTGFT